MAGLDLSLECGVLLEVPLRSHVRLLAFHGLVPMGVVDLVITSAPVWDVPAT